MSCSAICERRATNAKVFDIFNFFDGFFWFKSDSNFWRMSIFYRDDSRSIFVATLSFIKFTINRG